MGRVACLADPLIAPYAGGISLPNFAAYKDLTKATEAYWRADFEAAITSYKRVAELDPSVLIAHVWVGWAHYNNEEFEEAAKLARHAAALRDRLTPYEQNQLDALDAGLRGDVAAYYRYWRRSAGFSPKLGSGYWIGEAALRLNRPRETIDWLIRIDSVDPHRSLVWYWQTLTDARHMLAEHDLELEAASLGRRQHPDSLGTLFSEARALVVLKRIEEVGTRVRESTSLSPDPEWSPGEVMEQVGLELRAHAHADAARNAIQQSVAWFRNRPVAEANSETMRYGLARALYAAAQLDEARSVLEALRKEVPDKVDYPGCLGTVAARTGHREEAAQIASELLRIDRPYLFGIHTLWRARIAAFVG